MKKFAWAAPLIAAATMIQAPIALAASKAPASKTAAVKTKTPVSAALTAEYNAAVAHLARNAFVQVTSSQKTAVSYQLTALGKKTPAVAKQLKSSIDNEKYVARIDASNGKQPLTWYDDSDSMSGSGVYFEIGSKFFSNTGKGWKANGTDLGSVSNMITLRDIPPLNSFVKPVVKTVAGGFTISGVVNVVKYYAEVPSEATAMSLALPGLTRAEENTLLAKIYEYDSVTVRKVGASYVVTQDAIHGTLTISPSIMAQMLGASPSALSMYLSSVSEKISGRDLYSYSKAQVQIPAAIQKLLGNSTTVTGSVYGTGK